MTVIGGEFGEHGERPAPVLDIGEISPARIAELGLALANFVQQDKQAGIDEFMHPEWAFHLRGKGLFYAPVIEHIISAAKDSKRDLTETPITIAEVATVVERQYRFDLSASKTTPFLWSEERKLAFPNFDKLALEGNEHDIAFSAVFGDVRASCVDDRVKEVSTIRDRQQTPPQAIVDM